MATMVILENKMPKISKLLSPIGVFVLTLLFYFLIYRSFHDSFFIKSIYIFFYGIIVFPFGLWTLRKRKVSFREKEIKIILGIYFLFVIGDIILTLLGTLKLGLTKDVNIALSFLYNLLGRKSLVLTFSLGYFMSFIFGPAAVAFSYAVSKKGAKYFWLVMFVVWAVSGLKLITLII